MWVIRAGSLCLPGGNLYDGRSARPTRSPERFPHPRDLGSDSVDPTGDHCLYFLKIWCPAHVPWPDQLVGTAPARVDGSKRDHRNPCALVSEILSGPNRCGGGSDIYSGRLGPGPISALGHTGCHYSKRRCTRVDLKAFAASPWSKWRCPAAVTLLPLSNFQAAGTALTLVRCASHSSS